MSKLLESLMKIEKGTTNNVAPKNSNASTYSALYESLVKRVNSVNTAKCKTNLQITNLYEKALQEGIEAIYPNKHWTDTTKCDIRTTLLETGNNVEETVKKIVNESLVEPMICDAYIDMEGCFVGRGEEITIDELHEIYEEDKSFDQVIQDYDTFEAWLKDSIENGYLEPVCDNVADDYELANGVIGYSKDDIKRAKSLGLNEKVDDDLIRDLKRKYEVTTGKYSDAIPMRWVDLQNSNLHKIRESLKESVLFEDKNVDKLLSKIKTTQVYPDRAEGQYMVVKDNGKIRIIYVDFIKENTSAHGKSTYTTISGTDIFTDETYKKEIPNDTGKNVVIIADKDKFREKLQKAKQKDRAIKTEKKQTVVADVKDLRPDDIIIYANDFVKIIDRPRKSKSISGKIDAEVVGVSDKNRLVKKGETKNINLDIDGLVKKVVMESLKEDTVKQGNYWVNKGKNGIHGKFRTKKEADAQRRAMFANAEDDTQKYVINVAGGDRDRYLKKLDGDDVDVVTSKAEAKKFGKKSTASKFVKNHTDELGSNTKIMKESHVDLSEKPHTMAHALKATIGQWGNAKTKEEAIRILTKALKDEGLDTPATKKFLYHINQQSLNKIIETATNYMLSGADLSMRRGTPGYDKGFRSKNSKNETLNESEFTKDDEAAYQALLNGATLRDALNM